MANKQIKTVDALHHEAVLNEQVAGHNCGVSRQLTNLVCHKK